MNISKFFIERPIFAGVLSVLLLLAGTIAIFQLPVAEYPEVIPTKVTVHAQYPGANPKVIAETVAAPIEQQINGVENMLYMQSQANSNGELNLVVTFKLGTDPDKAQQLVQNRVNQALPRLPEDVQRLGVTTVKASPTLVMAIQLVANSDRYDQSYLRNYALINIKTKLERLPGVGEVVMWGMGDYSMRIWLDPRKVSERGMTADEVVAAIKDQNVQVAVGSVGSAPSVPTASMQLNVNAKGRLNSEAEFGDIVLKTSPDGGITYLKDVARVELGADDYSLRGLMNNKTAVHLLVNQLPGANSLDVADATHETLAKLATSFPEGMEYYTAYDPTKYVRASIHSVIHTLFEAIFLVVLVVVLFLQNWRASLIPLLAVPVSIVGTFSLLLAFGFTINNLSLFGLVLAIGIVVDDAIVVVENVERNIANGLTPKEATNQAMSEVTGPIIAIALTLVAVFVPLAFMTGLTGQFYKQFAMTIAISTVISAFNSLTLSPALSAVLLKGHHDPKDWLTRAMDRVFGGFFGAFNKVFHRGSESYGSGIGRVLNCKAMMMGVYALLIGALVWMGNIVPGGFIPVQDKGYLIAVSQLPNGASLDRTEQMSRQMADFSTTLPGVNKDMQVIGLSVNGFDRSSSASVSFINLKDFDDRDNPESTASAITATLNKHYATLKGTTAAVFPPPPLLGLGTLGGFKMQLEDQGNLGYEALKAATDAFIKRAAETPELGPTFTSYEINVPQLNVELDRVKAKQMGVSVVDVFNTMQVYLGSLYVNDFNKFGRVYQVRVQADAPFRATAADIGLLKTRNAKGEMVPLSALVKVTQTYGPEILVRYNGYTAADISSGPAPGYSQNQAQDAAARIAAEVLPKGITYEWTDLTYQQILAGNSAMWIFPISVLLVFLVLSALYESLMLPLAVILIVPMSILSALFGVWITNSDNNIFVQIGLIVLVGLSAKNAILIVEFARELEMQGRTIVAAAIEASRLRLRPILMTSIAFIMGVVPLVISTGPGSEMRNAMGVAVLFGMLGVTFFGLMLTPVFYVLLRKMSGTEHLVDKHGDAPHIDGIKASREAVEA